MIQMYLGFLVRKFVAEHKVNSDERSESYAAYRAYLRRLVKYPAGGDSTMKSFQFENRWVITTGLQMETALSVGSRPHFTNETDLPIKRPRRYPLYRVLAWCCTDIY